MMWVHDCPDWYVHDRLAGAAREQPQMCPAIWNEALRRIWHSRDVVACIFMLYLRGLCYLVKSSPSGSCTRNGTSTKCICAVICHSVSERNTSVSAACVDLSICVLEHLDGDDGAAGYVSASCHDSVGTLPQSAQVLVVLQRHWSKRLNGTLRRLRRSVRAMPFKLNAISLDATRMHKRSRQPEASDH